MSLITKMTPYETKRNDKSNARNLRDVFDLPNVLKKMKNTDMSGQGSAGNVIAALCSFFIPGLGQLLQGRLFMALIQFVLAGILWCIWLGWIIHLWSIIDAAMFKPRS